VSELVNRLVNCPATLCILSNSAVTLDDVTFTFGAQSARLHTGKTIKHSESYCVRPSSYPTNPTHRSAKAWDTTHVSVFRCVVVESHYVHRHCVSKDARQFDVDSMIEGRSQPPEGISSRDSSTGSGHPNLTRSNSRFVKCYTFS